MRKSWNVYSIGMEKYLGRVFFLLIQRPKFLVFQEAKKIHNSRQK